MKQQSKKMSEQEKKQWNNLYQYVKKNILEYDDNQSLSNSIVLRLKGLSTSKFMENKNINSMSKYSYEVILNTFKFCSPVIQKALKNKNFIDDTHKINYIIKIVEPKINTIYKKMKDNELSKKKREEIDSARVISYQNHFQSQDEEINPILVKEFEDLW